MRATARHGQPFVAILAANPTFEIAVGSGIFGWPHKPLWDHRAFPWGIPIPPRSIQHIKSNAVDDFASILHSNQRTQTLVRVSSLHSNMGEICKEYKPIGYSIPTLASGEWPVQKLHQALTRSTRNTDNGQRKDSHQLTGKHAHARKIHKMPINKVDTLSTNVRIAAVHRLATNR